MKIGLSIRRFGRVGGMENVAYAFAHWLADSGHDVEVWASKRAGEASGVRVRKLSVRGRGVHWKAHSLRRAAREIPVNDYDGFLHFERGGIGGTYRAGAGCHASWVRKRGARIGDRWLTAVDCETMSRADRVVVNSQMVRAEAKDLYGIPEDRLHVVRNVVDLNRFSPSEKALIPTVVFPGGDVERKGLRVAADAMRRVPDADFVVLGAVSRRTQAWIRSIHEKTRFMGYVTDPERVFASAHAVLLPTMYDPSSNAVLEAMACGTPVVTTIHDGASELLPHRWMALSDPLDVDACAEVLLAVMNDSTLGPKCREIASKHPEDLGFAQLLNVVVSGDAQ